jgi:NAD(P)-dependent dehydrogenase (short-subunit alcohol dehydrogenase family)
MQLKDSHVVITGAASGIGAALALRFAAEGARALALADRNEAGVHELAARIGPQAQGYGVDVTKEAQIADLVKRTTERNGPIDLFCSNAGISVRGGAQASDADWQLSWNIHVMAHVYAARAVLPGMIERRQGYLLQTASAAGLLTQIGSAPYSVTKHAAVALAEWLAIEHHHQGIRVSVICPQAVRTAMLGGGVLGQKGPASMDGVLEPEQVAECAVQGLAEERFLILPHAEVGEYVRRKAGDPDRWLAGMRRLRQRLIQQLGLG